MYCSSCGQQLQDATLRSCPHCGKVLMPERSDACRTVNSLPSKGTGRRAVDYTWAAIWFFVAVIQWTRVINETGDRLAAVLDATTSSALRNQHLTYLLLMFLWSVMIVFAVAAVLLRHRLAFPAVLTVSLVGPLPIFVRGLIPLEIVLWLLLTFPFLFFFARNRSLYRETSVRARMALLVVLISCGAAVGLTVGWNYYSAIRLHLVSGEVFAAKRANVRKAAAARLYAFSVPYADQEELWSHLPESVTAFQGRQDHCSNTFIGYLRHFSGLSHPYDAQFYKLQQEWGKITSDPDWWKLSAERQRELKEFFWREKVLEAGGFRNLTKNEQDQFHLRLFDQQIEDLIISRFRNPDALADSEGRFSLSLRKGTYLIVAYAPGTATLWLSTIRIPGSRTIILATPTCGS